MCKFWLFSNRFSRARSHTRAKSHKGTSKFSNTKIFLALYLYFKQQFLLSFVSLLESC